MLLPSISCSCHTPQLTSNLDNSSCRETAFSQFTTYLITTTVKGTRRLSAFTGNEPTHLVQLEALKSFQATAVAPSIANHQAENRAQKRRLAPLNLAAAAGPFLLPVAVGPAPQISHDLNEAHPLKVKGYPDSTQNPSTSSHVIDGNCAANHAADGYCFSAEGGLVM